MMTEVVTLNVVEDEVPEIDLTDAIVTRPGQNIIDVVNEARSPAREEAEDEIERVFGPIADQELQARETYVLRELREEDQQPLFFELKLAAMIENMGDVAIDEIHAMAESARRTIGQLSRLDYLHAKRR